MMLVCSADGITDRHYCSNVLLMMMLIALSAYMTLLIVLLIKVSALVTVGGSID